MATAHFLVRRGVLPGTLLLLALPGCGRFDRGPAGAWDELARPAPERPGVPLAGFDPTSLDGLPAPAKRYLAWAIAPGTPLARSVELTMEGTIRLAPDRDPMAMEAEQILAPPDGFVWSARASSGLLRIRGYDRFTGGEGEMRWKLWGLVPVMRASGPDVTRSAAVRLVMEGMLVPPFLLPQAPSDGGFGGVQWEPVDSRHAAFRATLGGEEVRVTVEVDDEGRPLRAWAPRWNEGRYETFGVTFSGELAVGGYRIPARVQAGWRPGAEDAFTFFDARLTGAVFR